MVVWSLSNNSVQRIIHSRVCAVRVFMIPVFTYILLYFLENQFWGYYKGNTLKTRHFLYLPVPKGLYNGLGDVLLDFSLHKCHLKKYPVKTLISYLLLALECFPFTLEKGFKGQPLEWAGTWCALQTRDHPFHLRLFLSVVENVVKSCVLLSDFKSMHSGSWQSIVESWLCLLLVVRMRANSLSFLYFTFFYNDIIGVL